MSTYVDVSAEQASSDSGSSTSKHVLSNEWSESVWKHIQDKIQKSVPGVGFGDTKISSKCKMAVFLPESMEQQELRRSNLSVQTIVDLLGGSHMCLAHFTTTADKVLW